MSNPLADLINNIKAIKAKGEEIIGRIQALKDRIIAVKSRLENIYNRVNALKTMIEEKKIRTSIEQMKGNMARFQESMTRITELVNSRSKELDDMEDFISEADAPQAPQSIAMSIMQAGGAKTPTPLTSTPFTGSKFSTHGIYIKKTIGGRNIVAMTKTKYGELMSGILYGRAGADNLKMLEVLETYVQDGTTFNVCSYAFSGDGLLTVSVPFRKMTAVDVQNRVPVKKTVANLYKPKG